ncbi:RHS repeat-associated core domain-containing protein [Pseudomonas sp. R2.Fl]|nr:RHS repeat-associated core domain-containing protein [Pseudomonas sp. R2.Fl]
MHPASVVRNFSANQITGIAWTRPGQAALGTLGYGYDALGRRVAQTGTYASQLLPEASRGSNTFDDNNRQTRHDGKTLSYDANGNLLSDGQRTYHWNARNQLVAIKVGDSVQASFQYDPLGRRISKTEGGQTTTYLYDGVDIVQERMGHTVNPVLTGLGIDQRFARNEGNERSYFLTDALGSTRALTNAAGEVIQRYDYTPYGQTRALNAGTTNPYQYTGRERDASDIYYHRARYYSPERGRFKSEDPVGMLGGVNTYAYVGNDPVSYVDLDGRQRARPSNPWNAYQQQNGRQGLTKEEILVSYRKLRLETMGKGNASLHGALENFPNPIVHTFPDMSTIRCNYLGHCTVDAKLCKCARKEPESCPANPLPSIGPGPQEDPSCFCTKVVMAIPN